MQILDITFFPFKLVCSVVFSKRRGVRGLHAAAFESAIISFIIPQLPVALHCELLYHTSVTLIRVDRRQAEIRRVKAAALLLGKRATSTDKHTNRAAPDTPTARAHQPYRCHLHFGAKGRFCTKMVGPG